MNSKNYPEASGPKALELAEAIERASDQVNSSEVRLYLAAPAFSISELSKNYPRVPIFAQHLDTFSAGSTTGHLVPEIAKLFGASGTLLNHSEHRIKEEEIQKTVDALKKLQMKSVVCARDAKEVGRLASFAPDFIAIEPPELIGSGNAISKARPELITESKDSLESALGRHNSSTILLCGAGIVDNADVRRAKELGADGILIASGVIKAKDWFSTIVSLVSGFYP